MKRYMVKAEFLDMCDMWGINEEAMIDELDVEMLAEESGMSIESILNQLVEIKI